MFYSFTKRKDRLPLVEGTSTKYRPEGKLDTSNRC